MRHFNHSGPLWRGLSSPPVSRIEAPQRRIVSSVPALLMGILAAVSIIGLLLLPPISQDQDYHQFADQRTLLGIPNFWNVISNLPFIAVGALGLMRFYQKPATFLLFSGFLLTGFGSSYYHWNPSDDTLFWDRLPMTLCFMAILAIAIEERIDAPVGALLLWPLLGLGLFSLLLWRWTGDLRLYVWVQLFSVSRITDLVFNDCGQIHRLEILGYRRCSLRARQGVRVL
jgi:hypothetical protein